MKRADGIDPSMVNEGMLRLGAESPMTERERWLVGLCGPLAVLHGDFVDSVLTGHEPGVLQKRLQKTAGIHDRGSFERVIHWFQEEGDRRTYRALWRLMLRARVSVQRMPAIVWWTLGHRAAAVAQARLYSKSDYELVGTRLGMPATEVRQKLDAAREWVPLLPSRVDLSPETVDNLLAWDVVRLVGVTRWAIGAGYIERHEFEKFASGLAQRVQEVYRSWTDYSAAYLVGGLIWGSEAPRRTQLMECIKLLNSDPRSPFARVIFR